MRLAPAGRYEKVRNSKNLLQYWLGNAKIHGGKVKPEMNNLRFDILQKTLFVYPAKLAGY